MSEQDPALSIRLGGNEVELNRSNTFLFTFLGELAIHDHVFIVTEPEQDMGAYIFKACYPEQYVALANYMLENEFTAHLHLQEVGEGDRDAFGRATMGDLLNGNGIPEEWYGTESQ